MLGEKFTLRYSPQFYDELSETIRYITFKLRNPEAAQRLRDDAERAILDRLEAPLSFAAYYSDVQTGDVYYRINVRNFAIYYVLVGNVMEVRWFRYFRRRMGNLET